MQNNWSEKFNALPPETRRIASMVETQMRINQLLCERERLSNSYLRSIHEVDAHIKNLKKWLRDHEDE